VRREARRHAAFGAPVRRRPFLKRCRRGALARRSVFYPTDPAIMASQTGACSSESQHKPRQSGPNLNEFGDAFQSLCFLGEPSRNAVFCQVNLCRGASRKYHHVQVSRLGQIRSRTSPSPQPSPLGRGRIFGSPSANPTPLGSSPSRTLLLPLLEGEGRGEGEPSVGYEPMVVLSRYAPCAVLIRSVRATSRGDQFCNAYRSKI